ncbi:MAG: monovalent cation:proton antiporter-2 (CPA2) family protein, partial [Rhodospirillaceae bacterium]
VFKRLGLGSVLGYLTAGILIGPEILGLIQDVDTILHFGELGVVFLLFLIGLELRPERLWSLRKPIFGMGGLQVLLSFIPLAGLAWIAGLNIAQSFVVGMALALSSTAFCLQILAEKGHLRTTYGRNAFSILLFQDLAVVPLLALVPILAPGAEGEVTSWTSNIIDFGIAAGVIAAVIVAGHYLVSPLLGIVAKTELPELFTAAGLVVVLGVSALMYAVELSMALGAFLAGVLLAESEYRHELESVIQPFKGLLLGLFFIAVGMSVQMDLVAARPWEIIQLVVLLLVVKGAVLFAVARLFGATKRSALSLATLMSQGGEFSFVLFTLAVSEGVMNRTQASLLLVVVTLSMAATPFMVMLNSRFQNHLKRREASTDPE